MSLKGPIFPKIKAALKSLIKDKTKEHTVKITPFGATKHLIVGKTDPLMLGINIEETQNGFIYIGEEELEGAMHEKGITYLPIPSERFNHVRKFFEMQQNLLFNCLRLRFNRRLPVFRARIMDCHPATDHKLAPHAIVLYHNNWYLIHVFGIIPIYVLPPTRLVSWH